MGIISILQKGVNWVYSTHKNLKDREARFAEEKRLLERQRIMLKEDSVFLVEDFLRAAVYPLGNQDENFKLNFAKKIEGWFNVHYPELTLYPVPYIFIKDQKIKDSIVSSLVEQAEININFYGRRNDNSTLGGIDSETIWMSWGNEEIDSEEYKRRVVSTNIEDFCLPAVHLQELGDLLSKNGFVQYENGSIKKGKGAAVLEFWRVMQGLDDYSHLFKDDIPRGNNRRDERDTARARPALVPIPVRN